MARPLTAFALAVGLLLGVASGSAAAQISVPYVDHVVTIPLPAGHALSGTLTIPAGNGPFIPAASEY